MNRRVRLPVPAVMGRRRGRVRPRSAVVAAAGGLLALVVVAGLASKDVLALGLTSAHKDTMIYIDGLSGNRVGIVGTTAAHASDPNNATPVDRARLGLQLRDVVINGLCLVATHEVPGVGSVSAVITGGEPVDGTVTGTDPVRLDELALDISSLSGRAHDVEGLTLGRSAADVPGAGEAGGFGIAVDRLRLDGLTLTSGALELSSGARLPNLGIRTVAGTATREDCA